MIKITRKSFKTPGYDCINEPCKHQPVGNHGISSEEWSYVVSTGDVALHLPVISGIYPNETVKTRGSIMYPHAGIMNLHVGFPTTREMIAGTNIRGASHQKQKCEWIETGICYPDGAASWGHYAEQIYRKAIAASGIETFEQPEAFWLVLEQALMKQYEEAHEDRTDTKYERCQACDGCGTVLKEKR